MHLKQLALLVAAMVLFPACREPVQFHSMPPVTHQKAPIVDVAPRDTAASFSHMYTRAPLLKKRIAVSNFQDSDWAPELPVKRDDDMVTRFGGRRQVSDLVIDELHKSGRFEVVERQHLDAIIDEHGYEGAPRNANFPAAQAVVLVAVGTPTPPVRGGVVSAYLRMVDVATATVQATATGRGATVQDAVRQASAELIEAAEQAPWIGRVARVEQEDERVRIVINAGSDLGLMPGDVFAVYARGEIVTDPDNGELLGHTEHAAGVIRVLHVQEKLSIAEAVELTRDVSAGDIIRPALPKRQ